MVCSIPKPGLFALAFVFYGASSWSAPKVEPVDELKKLAIAQCKKLSSQDQRLECIVSLAKSLKVVEQASQTKVGHKVINGCSTLSMSANVGVDAVALFQCVEQQYSIQEQHPYPLWVDAFLAIPDFRAEWVARCHKQTPGDVTRCVQRQEVGFMQFWQEYSHLSEEQRSLFLSIKRCVGNNLFQYDFSSYLSCPKK